MLALLMGRTPSELESTLSAREFAEYQALFAIQPFGPWAEDLRTARICAEIDGLQILFNHLVAFGWSGVCVNNANRHWNVCHNFFSGTTSGNPSYWGGAIDVMGQTSDGCLPGDPDEHGLIQGNRFMGGYYRYGQVVRLSSARNVDLVDNLFQQPDVDNLAMDGGAGSHVQANHVVLTARDLSGGHNNGPCKNIGTGGTASSPKGSGSRKQSMP